MASTEHWNFQGCAVSQLARVELSSLCPPSNTDEMIRKERNQTPRSIGQLEGVLSHFPQKYKAQGRCYRDAQFLGHEMLTLQTPQPHWDLFSDVRDVSAP